MHPLKTAYYLAADDADYARCSAMPEATGFRRPQRDCPLIVAEQGDVLLGWLGSWTEEEEGWVVVGPLVTQQGLRAPGVIALRLCEGMEAVLRQIGATWYLFPVDRERDAWRGALTKLFGAPVMTDDGTAWFHKSLAAERV